MNEKLSKLVNRERVKRGRGGPGRHPLYDVTMTHISFSATENMIANLDHLATLKGITRSELLRQITLGYLTSPSAKLLLNKSDI